MKQPELSIVIPVYNVEKYLNRCLDSIINQPYQEFEVILVDDGSTDRSGEILDEYANKDDRFIVIHQANGGVSAARNAALKKACGTYLTFVDPDDYIDERTYIDNMTFLMEHLDVDVVQYPYTEFVEEGKPLTVKSLYTPRLIEGKKDIFASWWAGSPLQYVLWNKIYKRSLWQNLEFVVGHISEDTRMIVPLCKRSSKVYLSDKGMYLYRRDRVGSYTHKESFAKHIDLFDAHCLIFKVFENYPELTKEKVMAFTRLFRRVIQAKFENPQENINKQLFIVNQLFPTYKEILQSNSKDANWLIASKTLGPRLFTILFISYLKLR